MLASFKPFEDMTADDYASVGLKCGLEVHQQLLTKRKLFCRCPAGRYSGEYDAEILRHMRPTLSELGEYDGTALMEKKTRKNIYYRIHHSTVCTYEFDDTPPFLIDPEALDISLEVSLLLRLNVVGELHIARKQYLDGSIPTGFQRTAIIGVTGWIPYKDRRVGIRQLSIEEDSCREVSDEGHDRFYLTDRLGMPLIEVVTEPDMCTPEECAEVCQIIRMLCRSTGHVRTGYGAAREDVNVSVRGGTRVEIKGVPRIPRIPRLIYNEAMRQCALLDIRHELKQRGVTPQSFVYSTHDVTRALSKCPYEPVRAALAAGKRVKCVVLNGFAGLLNHPTQEHTTFATEFSDRVRVVACLSDLPNIVHSDTAAEFLPARDWKQIRKRTDTGVNDALVLVWGCEADVQTACNEIALRAREATEGVPSDTRQALRDGTTGFERVLPGAERMYPDTDLPPIEVAPGRLDRIRNELPEFLWDRQARLRDLGLSEATIGMICMSRRADLFDRITQELKTPPKFAVTVLFEQLKALRRADCDVASLTDDDLFAIFAAVADGRLTREGVPELLKRLLTPAEEGAEPPQAEALLAELGTGAIADDVLKPAIKEEIAKVAERRFATPAKKHRFLMGELMHRFVGRLGGRRLKEELREQLDGGLELNSAQKA